LITIIIGVIWVKIYGIYWASIAFGLGNMIYWILSFVLLKKDNYKFKVDWKFIVKNVILLLILWFVVYYAKDFIFHNGWNRWLTILWLVIIWFVYYFVIWIFNGSEIKKLKIYR
jgi:hypothetical protein